MKRSVVMIIGAIGAGKTTLLKALTYNTDPSLKTQSITYSSCTIDTPGEFVENPYYYKALFSTSLEADILLFVQDATKKSSVFPPGFACAFSKRSFGVITKIDHNKANFDFAKRILKKAGLSEPIVGVSAITNEGLEELKKILNWD